MEELVRQVRDLLANRVLAQLGAVARMRLADVPLARGFRLDAFAAAQASLVAAQASVLAIRCGAARQPPNAWHCRAAGRRRAKHSRTCRGPNGTRPP
jgi:hypothetical protein